MISSLGISDVKGNFRTEKKVADFFFPPRSEQPKISEPYRVNSFALGLYHSGSVTLIADLKRYELTAKSLVFLTPKVIREWQFNSDVVNNSVLFFSKDFMAKQLGNTSFQKRLRFTKEDSIVCLSLTDSVYKSVAEEFHQLYTYSQQTSNHNDAVIAHKLMVLMYRIDEIYLRQNKMETRTPSRSLEVYRSFKALLNHHITSERKVAFYAKKLHITAKHLSQILKDETGYGASRIITEKVVLEAKVLLQDNTKTIAEVAYTLSFSNPAQFGKYFKSNTGLSPGEYRKKLTN